MAEENAPAVIDQGHLAALHRIDQNGVLDLTGDFQAMLAIELLASEVVMRAKAGIPIRFTLESQNHSAISAIS
jgi:hypothetical protein